MCIRDRSDGARPTMDLGGLRGGHTGDGSHVVRLTGHRSRPGPGPSTTGTRRRDAASLGIPARGGAHGGGVWRRSHRDASTLTVGGTEPDRHLYPDARPERRRISPPRPGGGRARSRPRPVPRQAYDVWPVADVTSAQTAKVHGLSLIHISEP